MMFRLSSRALVTALVLCAGLVLSGASSALAAGTTFFVAGGGSDGVSCAANASSTPFATIQRALLCAGPGDVISLAASGRPYPGVGTIATAGVTIEGPSARTTSIDAGRGQLTVSPGAEVTISGVTLKCQTSCAGAPTVTNEGKLVLSADAVTGNLGIPTSAILSTTAAGSSSPAGLTIRDTTISGNDSRIGGGLQTSTGVGATGATTATIIDSTIAGNVALQQGGGIAALAAAPGSGVTITGSTITGNTGSGGAGLFASSPVSLSNSIVAGDMTHAGGATDCQSSSVGSVIADGPGGHNLIGNAVGCGSIVGGLPEGDQTGVTHPGLLPLANNGGPTNTVALQTASPAVGTGDSATCTSADIGNLDQRGDRRVTASRGCDIGAFDSAGKGVVHRKYFVAPAGSDTLACTANRAGAPFATVQRALECATDGDVISLAPTGSTPYPGIGTAADNVTIQGASARSVSIDVGEGALTVAPGANTVLKGVSLACATACVQGPSVTDQGRLLLSADAVTGNTSLASSAILVVTPDDSAASAALTVADTTVSGNDSNLGGAIQTTTGIGATGASTLILTDSTIADNVALRNGGGIAALATTPGSGAAIVNSTITGNSASAGGGLYASSPVALSNTIVARNMAHLGAPTDCQSSSGGTIITDGPSGHNLVGDDTGCGAIAPGVDGDQAGSAGNPLDPRLGPLAYNGGTTETERPLTASPVIGAGSAASCEQQPVFDLDERLVSRRAPARDACDVGAVDTGGRK
jgi:fibronectin-binding autotransporter adhesin